MDTALLTVLKDLEALKSTRNDLWNITWDTGQFLRVTAIATKATRVLEIGMSNGFSTIWWAGAMRETGGKITTLEREAYKVEEASANFERAGVREYIDIVHGDARETLKTLNDGFDIAFVDAAKGESMVYLEAVTPLIRKGGLMITDNAVTHAEELKEYLEAVRNGGAFESVLVPIGQGEEVSLKL